MEEIKNNFSENNKVKCNHCDWEGRENDLYSLEDNEEVEYCPNCNKSGAIMDI